MSTLTYLSNSNFLTGLILAKPLEDNSQGSKFASGAGDFIGTLGDLAKQGLTKISEATGMTYIEWSHVTSFHSLFCQNVRQLTRLTRNGPSVYLKHNKFNEPLGYLYCKEAK